MDYDLVLKGGRVLDPASGLDDMRDIAIAGGKIAAIEPDIAPSRARRTAQVAGLIVTPGLIDMHMHAFGYSGSLWPDIHALANGATTVVDAGGAGWQSFPRFKREVIDQAKVRVLAYLNIVGAGMIEAHEQNFSEMLPRPAAEMVARYPDLLVGIKVAHYFGPAWEAIDAGVEAGTLCGKPVMVDTRVKPLRSYEDLLLVHLRPGDIHTHVYAQHIPLLDEAGRVQDYVWEARRRGVRFDTGHGAGSFWFRVAAPATAQGFWPDTISTDLHRESAMIPNAYLLTVANKFLNLGLALPEVIARCTIAPAQVLGHPELGKLAVGGEADVAVLQLEQGAFGYVDSGYGRLRGNQRLSCLLTIRAGKPLWDPQGLCTLDWQNAGRYTFLQHNTN